MSETKVVKKEKDEKGWEEKRMGRDEGRSELGRKLDESIR